MESEEAKLSQVNVFSFFSSFSSLLSHLVFVSCSLLSIAVSRKQRSWIAAVWKNQMCGDTGARTFASYQGITSFVFVFSCGKHDLPHNFADVAAVCYLLPLSLSIFVMSFLLSIRQHLKGRKFLNAKKRTPLSPNELPPGVVAHSSGDPHGFVCDCQHCSPPLYILLSAFLFVALLHYNKASLA